MLSETAEARSRSDRIHSYAGMIGGAIGDALAFLPEVGHAAPTPRAAGAHAVIAICAEQGFAGVFSDKVLDAAERVAQANGRHGSQLLLIGDRGPAPNAALPSIGLHR